MTWRDDVDTVRAWPGHHASLAALARLEERLARYEMALREISDHEAWSNYEDPPEAAVVSVAVLDIARDALAEGQDG